MPADSEWPETGLVPMGKPAFLVPPALALLIGVPLAQAPFEGDPRGFWGPYTLLALPFYLGVLAIPGYVALVSSSARWLHATAMRRLWMRATLVIGLACAAVGMWASTLLLLFAVPSLATGICCVILWSRFERAGRAIRRR